MGLTNYILFSSLLPFCIAKDTVPTFLIDYEQVLNNLFLEQNPFAKVSAPQFTEIVQNAIRQFAVVVLFVEETFSTEDVSIKDDKGTPFAYLHEEIMKERLIFIPNVVTPVKVITRLLKPMAKNVFVLKPGQLFHSTENLNYFYVYFNDNKNETRPMALRRHDLVIQHVYETIRKIAGGSVLGIYTGKVNPVSIPTYERGAVAGDGPSSPVDRGLILSSRSALYRFKGLTIDSGDRTRRAFFDEDGSTNPTADLTPPEKRTDDSLASTVVVGEYQLEFFFLMQSTRWRLDRIKLYEDSEWVGDHNFSSYIGAPYGMSYVCDEPLIFYNTRDHSAMVIPEYQIQPFRSEDSQGGSGEPAAAAADSPPAAEDEVARRTADDSNLEFGEAVQCTPYFTIGILSGLMVSALCLSILISGVFCLYHCETNSRFDDPLAKQIVIPSVGD